MKITTYLLVQQLSLSTHFPTVYRSEISQRTKYHIVRESAYFVKQTVHHYSVSDVIDNENVSKQLSNKCMQMSTLTTYRSNVFTKQSDSSET